MGRPVCTLHFGLFFILRHCNYLFRETLTNKVDKTKRNKVSVSSLTSLALCLCMHIYLFRIKVWEHEFCNKSTFSNRIVHKSLHRSTKEGYIFFADPNISWSFEIPFPRQRRVISLPANSSRSTEWGKESDQTVYKSQKIESLFILTSCFSLAVSEQRVIRRTCFSKLLCDIPTSWIFFFFAEFCNQVSQAQKFILILSPCHATKRESGVDLDHSYKGEEVSRKEYKVIYVCKVL